MSKTLLGIETLQYKHLTRIPQRDQIAKTLIGIEV
jgi:hypothetical protein